MVATSTGLTLRRKAAPQPTEERETRSSVVVGEDGRPELEVTRAIDLRTSEERDLEANCTF